MIRAVAGVMMERACDTCSRCDDGERGHMNRRMIPCVGYLIVKEGK